MAQITIDIPNQVVNRVLDAIAGEYVYDQNRDGTKQSFAKKQIIEFIKRTIKEYEGSTILKNAKNSNDSDVDESVVIT